ncbi:MAG: glycosyltransferase [Clostridium sp.]|nr:glycosyltransferase [Clostridium sp.]
MKISLCMIVKNEEKYIKMCLENAMKVADEAIIVDTGSTDRTKEIINEFGGNIKVIDYKWEDDFSKARNISIDNATGDWILMLDADEKLLCDAGKVKSILKSEKLDGYRIPLYNILDVNTVAYSAVYIKFFKNKNQYRYSGRIHEQLYIPNMIEEDNIMDNKICKVIHYGYLQSTFKEKDKSNRNLEILKKELKEDPNSPFVYYNIGVSYVTAGNHEKALKYFFKCNNLARKENPTGITTYEIEMARRIADCLIHLKKYDECIEMVDNLLSDDCYKGFVDLEYTKGLCYYMQKKFDEAIKSFEKCVDMGDTRKFISVLGAGSFKAKHSMAICYVELKEEVKAINCFMESVFDPNNFMHEGIEDFRKYLIFNKRIEILNQLNKLASKFN